MDLVVVDFLVTACFCVDGINKQSVPRRLVLGLDDSVFIVIYYYLSFIICNCMLSLDWR